MPLLAAGSALVAGSHQEEIVNEKRVRVTRAFYYQRKACQVGDLVALPPVFALEMIAAHKAEPVSEPLKSESKVEPKKPEPAPAPVEQPVKGKGAKDAGK